MAEYEWNLTDLKQIHKNNYKVFSCFSCGGGSTMGYKLAGYNVIGNCEIDKKINEVYVENHKPKYNYCIPIQEMNTLEDYPEELYDLDILDGSPPCSTFSLAGEREKNWGKSKKFREGQACQVLDDLFFEFIKLAKKLRPKIIVAENVKGIIMGNAKGYVNLIIKELEKAGYRTQIFLLNSGVSPSLSNLSVCNSVFFICVLVPCSSFACFCNFVSSFPICNCICLNSTCINCPILL